MAARPAQQGAEWFSSPAQANHRRYEALRAFFTEGLAYEQAGARFGYTRWAMTDLVRQHRAGKLELFAAPKKPGPPPGIARPRTVRAAGSSSCGGRACRPMRSHRGWPPRAPR